MQLPSLHISSWIALSWLCWLHCSVAAPVESSCADPGDSGLRNAAVVFLKPHANTVLAQDLVKSTLRHHGIEIVSERTIEAATIEKEKLIDQHYYAIASKATLLPASEIPVPADRFEAEFGESWNQVLLEKRALNALEACRRWNWTPDQLDEAWQGAEKTVKFGGGFYGASIHVEEDECYVFNGFFLTMRSQFVEEGASIFCMEVAWNANDLSWADFRSRILGPTDPSQAPEGSLRRLILEKYRTLGLSAPPSKGLNGVHGSASPLEGLAERLNWLGRDVSEDEYGKTLVAAGLPAKVISEWSLDPRIRLGDQEDIRGSLFDALEELDAKECLERMLELYRLQK